ncbi:MAG TPA: bacterial transcriptional activator domain-containing protein, partial [Candidatus Deferrimicrobiaceae bacterium]
PSPETEAQVATRMLPAALFRRPGMPGLLDWAKRAASLSRDSVDGDLKLQASIAAGMYYFWVGDRVRTAILVEDGRRLAAAETRDPAVYLSWTWVEAMSSLCGGLDREAARIALAGGLRAARESGIRVWDHLLHGLSAIASLMAGDAEAAARSLKDMQPDAVPARRQACAMHEYLCSWLHLLRGDTARAAAHAERALGHATASGLVLSLVTCRLAIANIAIERRRDSEAQTRVAEAWEIIRGVGSLPLEYMAHLTEARLLLARGNEAEALASLRAGLAIGRERGYLNTFWWWQPIAMARLCEKALAAGIETDYVRGLIVANDLAAEAPAVELEEWPWPLRIYTLDRFGLIRRGESVLSPGKAQQKPLTMLKALIAMGGRGVPESQLNDVLWPDVDGDLAHQSFATTLRRLRQLLGSEKSILMHDGRLTLNHRYCWVDVWAFERLLGRAESGRPDASNGDGPVRLVERAMALYRGPFLAGENFFARVVSVRERLRNKFLRAVEAAGRICEETGDLRRAIALYEKGLEVDGLTEEFYRCLISCYKKSGMNTEALRVYRRCVNTLFSGLGVAPSRETEKLAKSLITN